MSKLHALKITIYKICFFVYEICIITKNTKLNPHYQLFTNNKHENILYFNYNIINQFQNNYKLNFQHIQNASKIIFLYKKRKAPSGAYN